MSKISCGCLVSQEVSLAYISTASVVSLFCHMRQEINQFYKYFIVKVIFLQFCLSSCRVVQITLN